ncbi:FadR/GntR family transcriptional regulator [Microbacterium sulfonylureivorans]|uniref:FadR/GntR family transcriptional regulator n=1 Tax=Microbacterium sulfonylureivorans TaxID=2486854 RepID=UPI00197BB113|nr:FadR/GntR family transcriptional regulator [Microbacterium sulfonylureivorans]
MPPIDPSPRPRRSQQLVADLLEMIQQDVVRPGTRLPTEAELSERFGVSRTVVREAIAQLRSDGIVRSSQGRGTFVLAAPGERRLALAEADVTDLPGTLALLEFRVAVEVEAAALAARRRTGPQLGAIERALHSFGAAGDAPGAAVDADFAFHLRVARASGNPHFAAILDSLGTGALVIPKERLRSGSDAHRHALEEHTAVHAAIAAGDPLAASAAMRTHLANSASRLLAG